jgi:hypothetical protein
MVISLLEPRDLARDVLWVDFLVEVILLVSSSLILSHSSIHEQYKSAGSVKWFI